MTLRPASPAAACTSALSLVGARGGYYLAELHVIALIDEAFDEIEPQLHATIESRREVLSLGAGFFCVLWFEGLKRGRRDPVAVSGVANTCAVATQLSQRNPPLLP